MGPDPDKMKKMRTRVADMFLAISDPDGVHISHSRSMKNAVMVDLAAILSAFSGPGAFFPLMIPRKAGRTSSMLCKKFCFLIDIQPSEDITAKKGTRNKPFSGSSGNIFVQFFTFKTFSEFGSIFVEVSRFGDVSIIISICR